MAWKRIDGYRHPYRISDEGEVQRQLPDGRWRTLHPQLLQGGGGKASNVLSVKLAVPGGFRRVAVVRLMEGRFIRPRCPGEVISFRNRYPGDVRADNLFITTHAEINSQVRGNRRPVKKVDQYGAVLAVYPSIREAAQANYYSVEAVKKHLRGAIKDRFGNGYTFAYDR